LELSSQRLYRDAADDLVGEGVGQKLSGRVMVDAARAQVKNGLVVKLPNAGAVSALHIVGVNLELRLRVDHGVVRQEQRLVRLLGVGLLSVLVDINLAVENAVSPVVQDALVKLVAT